MKSKFPSSSGGSISLPGPPPLAHRSTRPGSTSSNDVRELAFMHFRLVPLCLALIFGTTSWGDAQSLLCYHNKNRHSRRCAYRVSVRTPRPREATNHLQTRHLVAASMGHLCGMQAIPTWIRCDQALLLHLLGSKSFIWKKKNSQIISLFLSHFL